MKLTKIYKIGRKKCHFMEFVSKRQIMPAVVTFLQKNVRFQQGVSNPTMAITDKDGRYVIEVNDLDETSLTFSCIGFKTKTVALAGRSVLKSLRKPRIVSML